MAGMISQVSMASTPYEKINQIDLYKKRDFESVLKFEMCNLICLIKRLLKLDNVDL